MWHPRPWVLETHCRFDLPKKKLTARFVETVTVETRTDFQDEQVPGLSLRVAPSGVKTWNVLYTRESDGAKQRLKIGRHPGLDLEPARKKALKVLAEIATGPDPVQAKKNTRAALTVRELGALFLEKHSKPNKRSWAEDDRILRRVVYPAFGDSKAADVTRRDVLDVIEAKFAAGAPIESNNILAVIRKMFAWAVDGDYIEASPAAGIKPRGKIVRRDRVLSDAEMKTLWSALPDAKISTETGRVLRLLFLTGQRSGEVCGIVSSEVEIEHATWTIPGARTKNGLTHVVPLSEPAQAVIARALHDHRNDDASDPVFEKIGTAIEPNAISKAVRLKLQITGKPWTPHDIRRTVATGMAGIGVAPHVIEACLNHISGFKAGVAGIYNRNSYEPEKRAAMAAWADHLEKIVGSPLN